MNTETDEQKIAVIITGGLITEDFNPESDSYLPLKSSTEIINSLGSNIDLSKVEIVDFSLIDSSSIDLEFLFELAKITQRKINTPNISGIVIVHGADTLEITSYFLYRCIYSHHKPIVITGAMRIMNNIDYDGKANIINSYKQVINPECRKFASGVTVNFAGKIHSPAYIQREHSFAIDPFSSGRLGVIGMMHIDRIVWLNMSTKSTIIPMPNKLEPIPIVNAYPGATSDYLKSFINNKCKGIVVIGYGSGNVSDNMYYAIESLIELNIKVVLVTNCKFGGVNSEYGGTGGYQSLKDLGVIMAEDLNAYQAMSVASLVFGNENIPKGANLENYFSNKILIN